MIVSESLPREQSDVVVGQLVRDIQELELTDGVA
jgi:hypothetical protein